jgi:hypothetical protein
LLTYKVNDTFPAFYAALASKLLELAGSGHAIHVINVYGVKKSQKFPEILMDAPQYSFTCKKQIIKWLNNQGWVQKKPK